MDNSILLVDDQALVRLSLTILLERTGYKVTETSNGVEALKKAAGKAFSLVITDLNMPEMDGLELVKRLRSMSAYKDVPVLMHTNESSEKWVRAGMAAGASKWIEKTFPSEILGIVRHFIGSPVELEDMDTGKHSCSRLAGPAREYHEEIK